VTPRPTASVSLHAATTAGTGSREHRLHPHPLPHPHETLLDELTRTMARQRADYMSGLFRSGVSTAHAWVLMKLRMHGELSMTGIAELLGIGLPNVTGLVDRM